MSCLLPTPLNSVSCNKHTHPSVFHRTGREVENLYLVIKGFCSVVLGIKVSLLQARKGGIFFLNYQSYHLETSSLPIPKELHDTISNGINGIFLFWAIVTCWPQRVLCNGTESCLGDQSLMKSFLWGSEMTESQKERPSSSSVALAGGWAPSPIYVWR